MVEIRQGDFALFGVLAAEYEGSLPPELRHPEFDAERERLSEVYSAPNVVFVARVDGDAGGCVALVERDAVSGIVKKLYVRPARRGLGLARALMHALIEQARARGYARVVLDTDREALGAAYRLYLSLGFRECASYGEVAYRCPTYMELSLQGG